MYRIGVDIGGTNIALGLLDEELELKDSSSIPFQRGGERVAARIAEQVRLMLEKAGAGVEDPASAWPCPAASTRPARR